MRQTPHQLVSGRVLTRTLIFHSRVKVRPRRDGTLLRKRNPKTQARLRSHVCPGSRRLSLARRRWLEAWPHHGAGWYQAGFQIAPERHHKLAGQRHDGDLADPPLDLADPREEPAAQLAIGLMPQPQPGKLDGDRSRPVVAGFADALLSPAGPTVVRCVGQSEATADLTSVVEVTIEHLVGEN